MMKKCFRIVPAALLWAAVLLSPLAAVVTSQSSPGLHTIDAGTPQGLQDLFAPGPDVLPLVSAHRGGAAKGFPENCIATFEQTLRHCWSMLEIDPRYTKDHILVLNHDPTLQRTTSGTGRVADHTLAELKQLRLKDLQGNLTEYRMPTLDEALEWARGKTILVLDNKDVPIQDLVRKIEEHHAEACAMVMAYNFEAIKQCHALNKDIMMEIMVGDRKRLEAFDKTGVPWRDVIAFVGHTPPREAGLCEQIHAKGARCLAGTSRNIDLRFLKGHAERMELLEPDYRALLKLGVDLIETDIPRQVGPLLYAAQPVPASKAKYFRRAAAQFSKEQIIAIADAVARDRGWSPQERLAYEGGHALWKKSLGEAVRLPRLEGHDCQAVVYAHRTALLDGDLSILIDKNTGEVLVVSAQ